MLIPLFNQLDPLTTSNALWQKFITVLERNRLAHALLLVGAGYTNLLTITANMAAAIFCREVFTLCGTCQSCQLIALQQHPDLHFIMPEKAGSIIKIDQMRDLQQLIFTSPQISDYHVVIITPAEKMNNATANALLKLLEEPPKNTYLMLIAEHISTLPPTIISRCQRWYLSSSNPLSNDKENNSILAEGARYSNDSGRGLLFEQRHIILNDLSQLLKDKVIPNAVALKWSAFEFNDLIWLLYLIHAELIKQYLVGTNINRLTGINLELSELAQCITLVCLFKQIGKLNDIVRNLNHNISINQLLVLDDFLLGYREISKKDIQ